MPTSASVSSESLASALPVAVGAALGSRMQGFDRVVVSFFGDGASNQGACHEAMNLAAIWKLPVIFLCENNQYAVTTHFSDVVAVENISDRASAYNMPGVLVDGQDVMAVHEATRESVARARAGDGPALIEARTYRYEDHSKGLNRILRDPYRTEEEVEEWRRRDPIVLHNTQKDPHRPEHRYRRRGRPGPGGCGRHHRLSPRVRPREPLPRARGPLHRHVQRFDSYPLAIHVRGIAPGG